MLTYTNLLQLGTKMHTSSVFLQINGLILAVTVVHITWKDLLKPWFSANFWIPQCHMTKIKEKLKLLFITYNINKAGTFITHVDFFSLKNYSWCDCKPSFWTALSWPNPATFSPLFRNKNVDKEGESSWGTQTPSTQHRQSTKDASMSNGTVGLWPLWL